MKEEIKVTVIATGFEHKPSAPIVRRPVTQVPQNTNYNNNNNNNQQHVEPAETKTPVLRPFGTQATNDQLDIPTFLRNRGKNSMND